MDKLTDCIGSTSTLSFDQVRHSGLTSVRGWTPRPVLSYMNTRCNGVPPYSCEGRDHVLHVYICVHCTSLEPLQYGTSSSFSLLVMI